MLCMQQCIDLCDLTPEEAQAIREYATLAEIAAIQAECERADGGNPATDKALDCRMLDMRDRLLEEVWAAEDFEDLGRVVEHYRSYAAGQDGDGTGDAAPDR